MKSRYTIFIYIYGLIKRPTYVYTEHVVEDTEHVVEHTVLFERPKHVGRTPGTSCSLRR